MLINGGCSENIPSTGNQSLNIKNIVVWEKEGGYGGWPANFGIWSWEDEIVLGFEAGFFKIVPGHHYIDRDRPILPMQARSTDGGESWSVVPFQPEAAGESEISNGGIDFTHPDFCMTLRMDDYKSGFSQFFISYDRAWTWTGPFPLPAFEQKWIAARTDYIVNSKNNCTIFLTASKTDGKEGRPFCARTVDGGKTWKFVSWITPEPEGFTIMPSTVQLPGSELITAIRIKEKDKGWLQVYSSIDNGESWTFLNDACPKMDKSGNPASMIRLQDGRICMTYGFV